MINSVNIAFVSDASSNAFRSLTDSISSDRIFRVKCDVVSALEFGGTKEGRGGGTPSVEGGVRLEERLKNSEIREMYVSTMSEVIFRHWAGLRRLAAEDFPASFCSFKKKETLSPGSKGTKFSCTEFLPFGICPPCDPLPPSKSEEELAARPPRGS